jgi:hypothetical protein
VVCARCHTLQHYGREPSAAAEALLPSFDFERVVGSRLRIASLRTRPGAPARAPAAPPAAPSLSARALPRERT